jgi:antitoxin component YwqK of YwqJK toxin-antitoxin module
MKKFIIILFLLLAGFNGFGQIAVDTVTSENLRLTVLNNDWENARMFANFDSVPFDGVMATYYPNTSLIENIVQYKNGQTKNCWSKSYYRNSQIRSELWHGNQNGAEHGKYTYWFENGKVKITGQYENGAKNGKWITYFQNGHKQSIQNFVDGEEKDVVYQKPEVIDEIEKPLDKNLQQKAVEEIKKLYRKSKTYSVIGFSHLRERIDSEELRKLCDTDKEISYSIQHVYNSDGDTIEEYVEFDSEMNILGIISMSKMIEHTIDMLDNLVDSEQLFEEELILPQLTVGRTSKWDYYVDDSLNIVMGFPKPPISSHTKLTNSKKTKSIKLTMYSVMDSSNKLVYSVKVGNMKDYNWSKEEIIEALTISKQSKISYRKEVSYYSEETTMIEYSNDDKKYIQCHIASKNDYVYIYELEGSREMVYSDLSFYFLGGIFYDIQEFKEIKNNKGNVTIDLTGTVINENEDTIDTYQIYVIKDSDTTYIDITGESKFKVSLPIGFKYVFGFNKEGHQQKHLVIDVVESGSLNDSKYGYEFPMQIKLLKGDINEPSTEVARVKFNPFSGYMDY